LNFGEPQKRQGGVDSLVGECDMVVRLRTYEE